MEFLSITSLKNVSDEFKKVPKTEIHKVNQSMQHIKKCL